MAMRAGVHQDFGRRTSGPQISITSNGKVRVFQLSTAWLVASGVAFATFAIVLIAATAYMLFRDEIVGATLARQVAMQQAYEDRITALRGQIDRINARQLLDQAAFEAKIDTLIARQDALKEHDAKVSAVLEKARAQGMKIPAGQAGAAAAATPVLDAAAKPFRASFAEPVGSRSSTPRSVAARIAAAEASIVRLADRQLLAIAAVAEMAERDAGRIERVVGKLGMKIAGTAATTDGVPRAKPSVAAGGPFVPAGDPAVLMRRAEAALDRLAGIRKSASGLPLGIPVKDDPQITSTFGNRSDPFLGVLAMHTGIDFRAETGDPVVATGAGTVQEAGRQGGYGLMVEIDHGHGVSTRFGHLSRIAVEAGQTVRPGQIVGYAGSTGRSTGPHLHYETRLNGDAVNPMPWLDAGRELRPVLR